MHIILLSAPPLTPRKSKKSLDYPQRDSLSSSSALQPAPLGTSVLLILSKMSQSMLILPGAISTQASNPWIESPLRPRKCKSRWYVRVLSAG